MQPDVTCPPHTETLPQSPATGRSVRRDELAGRFIAWLQRTLSAGHPAVYRKVFRGLAAVLAALFVYLAAHGPVLQLYYGHDNMGFLSFAWRIRNGIWPNADYHIPLGPLNTWIHAAGMWLLGPTAEVLPFCNALVGVGIGLLAWTVAARRLPAVLAGGFAFTQAIVAMSPHLMRFDWFASTYDCYYNRQCFAFLTTLMLVVFLPPGRADDRAQRRDDRTLGGMLGVLLFLKITFFMAGAGFCVLAFLSAKRPRRLVSWHLLAAFSVTVLLCLPMIRFDVLAMIADLRLAARARSANPEAGVTAIKALYWLWDGWFPFILLGAAQAALRAPLLFRRTEGDGASAMTPSWAEFAGVGAMSILLNITNAQGGTHPETPLLTSWLFVLAGYAVRVRRDTWQDAKPARRPQWIVAMTSVLACSLWVYTFGAGLCCLCWSASPWPTPWVKKILAQTPVFDSPSLASLRIEGEGGEAPLPLTYADKVNDGLRLLRKLGGVHRVGALDFNNPFPFALLWPPPRGDFWTWGDGYSFGETAHPSPDEAFGDADVLMLPKFDGEAATGARMRHLYGSYILEHFTMAEESDQWFVMQRR